MWIIKIDNLPNICHKILPAKNKSILCVGHPNIKVFTAVATIHAVLYLIFLAIDFYGRTELKAVVGYNSIPYTFSRSSDERCVVMGGGSSRLFMATWITDWRTANWCINLYPYVVTLLFLPLTQVEVGETVCIVCPFFTLVCCVSLYTPTYHENEKEDHNTRSEYDCNNIFCTHTWLFNY